MTLRDFLRTLSGEAMPAPVTPPRPEQLKGWRNRRKRRQARAFWLPDYHSDWG